VGTGTAARSLRQIHYVSDSEGCAKSYWASNGSIGKKASKAMLCEGHCRIGLKSIYGKMAVAEVGSQVVRSSDRVRAPGQPINVRSTFNASLHHDAPCRFARCPRSYTPGHRPQLCCTLNIEPRLHSQSQLYSSDIFGQQIALTTPSGLRLHIRFSSEALVGECQSSISWTA
jgi:hypothetical protein